MKKEKYFLSFTEYATYNPFPENWRAGRIEIRKIGGDIEKDEWEIDNIKLPQEVWDKLRAKLEGITL